MTYCCHTWSHQRATRMVTFLQTPWKLPSHLMGSWASSRCSRSPLPLVNTPFTVQAVPLRDLAPHLTWRGPGDRRRQWDGGGSGALPCTSGCGGGVWVANSLVSPAPTLPSSFLQNLDSILVSTHSSHSPMSLGKPIPGLAGNG